MATRGIASELIRLLDLAAAPVYVLDDQGRILLVNEACSSWAGSSSAALVGQECRYHSSGEVKEAEAIAAALAPPPEVWIGRRTSAIVSLPASSGQVAARHVEFVPLASDAGNASGVIAFASAELVDEASMDLVDADEESARELHDRLRRWRRELAGRYHLDRLPGDSPAMRQVRRQVELASASAASVTIVGPPGSGRQHLARSIHYANAAQLAGAFVPLVCPVLSTSLLESTIRALVRAGDAGTRRPATLLLSDVEGLAPEVQQHLARCLPVGCGVRVISTAREWPAALAAAGNFDADLACAISTIGIRLPPLRERLQDLPLLAQMLVEDRNRAGTKQLAGFTPEALDRLDAYPWPRNVAELTEIVAEAHRAAEGPHITPGDLSAKIHVALAAASRPRKIDETIVLEEFLARIEEELIRRALARAKGNKTKAARLLGMTRPRLYRRLVQLGLEEAQE